MRLDRASGEIFHHTFSDLPSLMSEGDGIVINETRVMKARLFGTTGTGGAIELLVTGLGDDGRVSGLVKGLKKLKAGRVVDFGNGMTGTYIDRSDDIAEFQMPVPGREFSEWMENFGHTPIPPYIDRDDDDSDSERYQSVFAHETGSCAAPTAGLHFTQSVLSEIARRGITIIKVTLHVGPGTFKPIKTENISDHTIDGEKAEVSQSAWEEVLRIKKSGGRIFAVGSTSVRALETAALKGGGFAEKTGLYISPGFDFKVVDGIVTNFHLPGSSLIVLVSAFAGREKIMSAYKTAIKEEYRFYSYGDAMLII